MKESMLFEAISFYRQDQGPAFGFLSASFAECGANGPRISEDGASVLRISGRPFVDKSTACFGSVVCRGGGISYPVNRN